MPMFAGKNFESMRELAELAIANPSQAIETFRVAGSYGNSAHGHLEIQRSGGIGNIDKIGIMAYEDLLIGAIRCVGTDYVEFAQAAGVEADSVRLDLVGTWDVRGLGSVFGLKVPKSATPGWNNLLLRATVRTSASKAAAEKATRIAWEQNVAAASLASVPTKIEVAVEAPMRAMAR